MTLIPFLACTQPMLSPVGMPFRLSGTFAEPRLNHFHSGIDIRTGGHEGWPVFAVAGGYVSRLKISAQGFGTVVYIDHPEGYTSVYAHLHHLSGELALFVDSVRLAERKNEIELFPDSGRFTLQAGGQLGVSGNTGSSEGPHLHFEWRSKSAQTPLNPLRYGFLDFYSDSTTPNITALRLYHAEGDLWRPAGEGIEFNFQRFEIPDTIDVDADTVGLAIRCEDRDSNNVNGVYSMCLLSEEDTIWYFAPDSFRFDDTRYVNAHIDFEALINLKMRFRRMFKLAGNAFGASRGSGQIVFSEPGQLRQVKAIVTDATGNADSVNLLLRRSVRRQNPDLLPVNLMVNRETVLDSSRVLVRFPAGAVYQDESVALRVRDSSSNGFKLPLITLQCRSGTPLHKPCEITWRDSGFYHLFGKQIYMYRIDERNQSIEYISVKKSAAGVSAFSRSWGTFGFMVDTIPPSVGLTGTFQDEADSLWYRYFEITEQESGLQEYNVYINGEWVICRYEAQRRRVAVPFDSAKPGPTLFELELSDAAGNRKRLSLLL